MQKLGKMVALGKPLDIPWVKSTRKQACSYPEFPLFWENYQISYLDNFSLNQHAIY